MNEFVTLGSQSPIFKMNNFIYQIFNDYASRFVPDGAELDLNPIQNQVDTYTSIADGVDNIKNVGYAIFDMFATLPPVINALIGVGFAVLISGIIVSVVLRII